MTLTRIYPNEAGETHFETIDIPLQEAGPIGALSERFPAAAVIFRENTADYDWDFHCAPEKQYVVMLDGELEIEVSSGEIRRFRSGDIILLEDTWGKGHRSTNVGGKKRRSLFIPLPQS